MSLFHGMRDNWSRSRRQDQPTFLGVNLNSRRTTTILLLTGTVLSAFLLTERFYLQHPSDHPAGNPRNLGRQAYAPSFKTQTTVSDGSAAGTAAVDPYSGDRMDPWDDEDDGWFMPKVAVVWNPLGNDTTPITEIQALSCFTPPGLFNLCSPQSTLKEDALRGKWMRVTKDLNAGIGIYYLYLFERRLQPGSRAPVITNMTLYNRPPTAVGLAMQDGDWVEVGESLRSGVWPRMEPMYLHYKTTPQAEITAARRAGGGSAGYLEPITEIDVLYGGKEVNPLYGYERLEPMITGGEDDSGKVDFATGKGRFGSSLALRRSLPVLPVVPDLRFRREGNFTILQVADLHFSTGPGACRDLDPVGMSECQAVGADVYSLQWLEKALAEVQPDLIVLSGDQSNGQSTSWSSESAILKWAPILWEKKIPWTAIFGNHDEEVGLSNAKQMELMQTMPYFIGEAGPEDVDGVGNYLKGIKSFDKSDTTLFNLYFLDSHAYTKSINPWKPNYDYLKPNQINWFRSQSAKVATYMRPYLPPRMVPAFKWPPAEATSKLPADTPVDFNGIGVLPPTPTVDEPLPDFGDDPLADYIADNDRRQKKRQDGPGNEMSTAVEPDDGAQVQDAPTEYGGDDDGPGMDDAELMGLDGSDWMKPSPALAVGPTYAVPLEAKPNAIAFFHIPLPESYEAIDVGLDHRRLMIGSRYEGPGSPKKNSRFFEEGLLAQGELPGKTDARNPGGDDFFDGEFSLPTTGRSEVKIVANGHCHISEDCRRVKGIWLCFGGGAAYSGYGKAGFGRRMRVFQISSHGEMVESWKVMDDGSGELDRIILVGEGAPGA